MAAEDGENAEVSLNIIGEIPLITHFEDNIINLQFYDNFGLNWTRLLKTFPYFYMKLIWPTRIPFFGFGPEVKKYLGYTSINFYASVIGEPDGWYAYVEPASITESTGGKTANLKLHIKVDKLDAPNSVTVQVRCVRILTNGEVYGTTYANISVKAAQYHFAEIKPVKDIKEAPPASQSYIPVDITNKGNYYDTFLINVIGENGVVGISSQEIIVLNPGETQRINIMVMTPEINFYDPGTIRKIRIEAYSINDPENKFIGEAVVKTVGFYISPPLLLTIGLIALLLLITISVLYYKREKELQNIYGKPEKPWKIPEEKKYLEKLKKENIEKYKKELEMMREEYQSALLWYKFYQEAMKPKTEREKKIALLEYKREKLQEKLEKKIENEWRSRREREYEEWKKECNRIQSEYIKKKAAILNEWERKKREIKEQYEKLNKERKEKGLQPLLLPEIPEPNLPSPPTLPPEPIKPPKPVVPKYEIDYEKMEIIPPRELFAKEEDKQTTEKEIISKAEEKDISKMRLLERIKKEQEKQLRKIKKQMESYKKQI